MDLSSFLESFAQAFGEKIIVMDEEEKNAQQELVEDLIALTTSFPTRIYGKRGGKKLIEAIQTLLQEEDNPHENNDAWCVAGC